MENCRRITAPKKSGPHFTLWLCVEWALPTARDADGQFGRLRDIDVEEAGLGAKAGILPMFQGLQAFGEGPSPAFRVHKKRASGEARRNHIPGTLTIRVVGGRAVLIGCGCLQRSGFL